jgi:hypothetical protein
MAQSDVGVVMVVQNDEETIARALSSVYVHASVIVVATDPWRGWSGAGITQDETRKIITRMDTARKVAFLDADFFRTRYALQNETLQRQVAADVLARLLPKVEWIFQVDGDEEFVDFGRVVRYTSRLPRRARCLRWVLVPLFQRLDDGRFLVVVDHDGKPVRERFYLAHRPGARLVSCRIPALVPLRLTRNALRLNEILMRFSRKTGLLFEAPADLAVAFPVLHYTFARSEGRVRDKLATWGHSQDIDQEEFFALWKRSRTAWTTIADFHPTLPSLWPALRPFTLEELRRHVRTDSATASTPEAPAKQP